MSKISEQFECDREVRTAKTQFSFHTGSTLLDNMIGAGISQGFPAGRIIHFMGESSSGKTFFACELVSAGYRQYKDKLKYFYDDSEHGYSFYGNSKKLWGIDIRKETDGCSSTVEELFYNVRKFLRDLKEDEHGIYIVDSLDALSNEETEKKAEERMKAGDKGVAFDKGSYGMQTQKFLSQEFFKKLARELEDKNSILVFLSQYRDNVTTNPYAEKRRVSGGSALKFYCDTEISLKCKEKFMKYGLHYGSCVEVALVKSKTDRPNRKVLVNLLFDYGIDDISTNIDYIYDLKSDATGQLITDTTCNLGDTSDPRYGKYPLTLDGVKGVLESEGLYETAVEDLKDAGIKRTKDGYLDWLKERHEDIYKAYYGEPISRDDYIEKADQDKDLRRVLREKAIAKWEAAEAMVACHRTKYKEDDEY